MRNCAVLLLAACLFSSCAPGAPIPVSVISRDWLEVKTRLLTETGDAESALILLDRFSATLAAFFASPIGKLYQKQPFDRAFSMESFSVAAGGEVEKLKSAVQKNERDTVLALVADIDAALFRLEQMDGQVADSAQTANFRLFIFFSALIIAVILLLAMTHRRMENALYREQQSLSFSRETIIAQEQERSRIVRELHDSVAQDIWRLSIQSDSIDKARTDDERRLLCAEVSRGHKVLMERVRGICNNLIPPDFRHQGLVPALRRLCHDFEGRTGIECRISIQEKLRLEPLDPPIQLQCFRLVQEALANIEKHSGSAEAVVVLRNSAASGVPVLLICVSDSGKGIPQASQASPGGNYERFAEAGHFGIRNMYERAAIINGKLTIDSEDGEGATVTLEIPLESPKNNLTDVTVMGGGVNDFYFADRRSPPGPQRNRNLA